MLHDEAQGVQHGIPSVVATLPGAITSPRPEEDTPREHDNRQLHRHDRHDRRDSDAGTGAARPAPSQTVTWARPALEAHRAAAARASRANYESLVETLGWDETAYEEWLVDTLLHALLPPRT